MDKEKITVEYLTEKWLEILRSGKHMQGKRKLVCDGRVCVLGALCVAADAEGLVKVDYERDCVIDYDSSCEDYCEDYYLPPILKMLFGGRQDVAVSVGEHNVSLSALNDLGVSFEYLADLIEYRDEYYLGLFDRHDLDNASVEKAFDLMWPIVVQRKQDVADMAGEP